MIPENRLLFALVRQNFQEKHQQTVLDICRHEDVNWEVVRSTAHQHGVAPLVYSNVVQCTAADLGIPERVLNGFKLHSVHNVVTKEKRSRNLTESLPFFSRKQIDVMLIKGSALDLLVYDHPWYMVADDLDLVLRRKKEEMTQKEIVEIMQFHHSTGIEYDYFDHHDVTLNGVLPMNFHRIWDDAVGMEFGEDHLFVMSPEDMLLSTCTNSCRKRFFRLKCLCDIAEIINRYGDLDWEKMVQNAKNDHCNSIVFTALLATKMTVGCELPENALSKLAVGPARAALIRQLVRYVSDRMPLSTLYPYSGGKWLNRKVNIPLILPYISYRPRQLWQRLKRLQVQRKMQD